MSKPSEILLEIYRNKIKKWRKCPFCKEQIHLLEEHVNDNDIFFDIECKTPDCYLESGADWLLDFDDLDKKWNEERE